MERMGPIEHNFSEGKGAGMPEQKPEPQESPAEQNPEEILGPQLPNEEEPFKPVTEDEFIRKEKSQESVGFIRKVRNSLRTPLGRAATLAIGLYMMSGALLRPKSINIEQSYDDDPPIEFVMPDGTNLKYCSWDKADFSKIPHQLVKPASSLQKIIETKDPFLKEVGLDPIKTENPGLFKKWVKEQSSDPFVLDAVGIDKIEEATPKQLAETAAAITVKNLDYTNEVTNPKGVSDLEKTAKEPVDKIVMESLRAECSHYAVVNEAIFNELKSQHPNKLANVYIGTMTDYENEIAHVWNKVIIVKSPSSGEVIFIDPTAPDYSDSKRYLANEDFINLEDWKQHGIIDPVNYTSLKYEYLQKQNISPEKAWEYIDRDFLSSNSDYREKGGNYADKQILNFLENYAAEEGNEARKETVNLLLKEIRSQN